MGSNKKNIFRRARELAESGAHVSPPTIMSALEAEGYTDFHDIIAIEKSETI